MRPMGRKPTRFPGKTDCHPPKGAVNWWEAEISTENKKAERANGRKEAELGLSNDIPDQEAGGGQAAMTEREST